MPPASHAQVIEAPGVSGENLYVQGVVWNGEPYGKGWISRDLLRRGGTLTFEMGSKPNPGWPRTPPTTC